MKFSKRISLVFAVITLIAGAGIASAQEWRRVTACTPHGDSLKCAFVGQRERLTVHDTDAALCSDSSSCADVRES